MLSWHRTIQIGPAVSISQFVSHLSHAGDNRLARAKNRFEERVGIVALEQFLNSLQSHDKVLANPRVVMRNTEFIQYRLASCL